MTACEVNGRVAETCDPLTKTGLGNALMWISIASIHCKFSKKRDLWRWLTASVAEALH